MKKVTYRGLIYTVEESIYGFYKLSGIGWRQKSDCTHWLAGWFKKFFEGDWMGLWKI